jgi:hypothetical protein
MRKWRGNSDSDLMDEGLERKDDKNRKRKRRKER